MGFPEFGGFYSKDLLLHAAYLAVPLPVYFLACLFGSLSIIYSLRLILLVIVFRYPVTFWNKYYIKNEAQKTGYLNDQYREEDMDEYCNKDYWEEFMEKNWRQYRKECMDEYFWKAQKDALDKKWEEYMDEDDKEYLDKYDKEDRDEARDKERDIAWDDYEKEYSDEYDKDKAWDDYEKEYLDEYDKVTRKKTWEEYIKYEKEYIKKEKEYWDKHWEEAWEEYIKKEKEYWDKKDKEYWDKYWEEYLDEYDKESRMKCWRAFWDEYLEENGMKDQTQDRFGIFVSSRKPLCSKNVIINSMIGQKRSYSTEKEKSEENETLENAIKSRYEKFMKRHEEFHINTKKELDGAYTGKYLDYIEKNFHKIFHNIYMVRHADSHILLRTLIGDKYYGIYLDIIDFTGIILIGTLILSIVLGLGPIGAILQVIYEFFKIQPLSYLLIGLVILIIAFPDLFHYFIGNVDYFPQQVLTMEQFYRLPEHTITSICHFMPLTMTLIAFLITFLYYEKDLLVKLLKAYSFIKRVFTTLLTRTLLVFLITFFYYNKYLS